VDTLIIVNPTAGAGRAGELWRRWGDAARRELHADAALTEGPGHARALAAGAVAAGCGRIVAVGGDGTLHEVVNGALPGPVRIAVVPVGTGNDFARCAGVPRDPRRALFGLAEGRIGRFDLGRVGDQYYLHVAGAGFDAAVAARVNAGRRRARGKLPYLAATLASLGAFRASRCRMSLDGRLVEQACTLVAAGNAPAYAGGLRICPGARMDDGLLEVCVIGDLGRLGLLALLPSVFSGAHVRHPRVSCHAVRRLRIEGPPDVAVHADGEPAGGLPAEFGVAPGALSLWMPST
jgi:diacylglycerol kinase (ATP)